MRQSSKLILATLLFFLSTGCATIMTGGGHSQQVRFKSEPRGAVVFVDNNRIGLTPVVAELTRGDDHVVRMEMDGYAQATTTIKHGPNLWTIGNVLIGGLVGIVVDLASGADEGVLNPNDVRLKMVKSEGPTDTYIPSTIYDRPYQPPPADRIGN